MLHKNKTIAMQVLNTSFSVMANDDNADEILEISAYVKDKLDDLKKHNPTTNIIQVAVLGCMNVAEDFFNEQKKCREATDTLTLFREENRSLSESLQKEQETCRTLAIENENFQSELQHLQTEHAHLNQTISEKESLITQFQEELKAAKAETEDYQSRITDLQMKHQEIESAMHEDRTVLTQCREQLEKNESETADCKKLTAELETQLQQHESEAEDYRILTAELETKLQQYESKAIEKEALIEQYQEELQRARSEIRHYRELVEKLQAEHRDYEPVMGESTALLLQDRDQIRTAHSEIDHCCKSMATLQDQLLNILSGLNNMDKDFEKLISLNENETKKFQEAADLYSSDESTEYELVPIDEAAMDVLVEEFGKRGSL